MNPTVRRGLIFVLLGLSLLPVGLLIPYYSGIYSALEQYHVQGLGVCWLGSYVLANLCAPGFMSGSESRSEYEKRGPLAIITLYLSVMMITFLALVVVSFVLWCLGWLLEFAKLFREWLKDRILGDVPATSYLNHQSIA
ncbi:MAG: hypothetical protein F6K00_26185 [Leptolyngbya sp. SIOISBB]|nr:hypothetical protein [Leptolyngbya sp. SIOISBB]